MDANDCCHQGTHSAFLLCGFNNEQVMKSFFLIFASFLFSSCYYNSRLVYLQSKKFSEKAPTIVENTRLEYHLQPSDVLSIKIKTANEGSPENNLFNITSLQSGMFSTPASMYLDGYTIDFDGNINLPILGKISVKGLTIDQAQGIIQINANKYLKNPTVIVKLTSFKITVLGEVKNPGYLYVYNNQATVLEALGLAGDLTPVASRKNVKLIRQVPSGSEVILIDLTDPKLLSSHYYYLMPNDVLYVEPLKARSKKTNLEILGVIFAGLTTAVLIFTYVKQY
jgi:polysaccharide export outer membrane protein